MSEITWKLTDDEYEFIKGEVAHIFNKYKIKCIPISGFEIASKMHITLMAYSSLQDQKLEIALNTSKDGFFIEFNSREYIFFNDIDCTYECQNWTILHEIGHIVLDHNGHSEHEESEADFFAKYAIAPPVLVYKIKAQNPEDIQAAFDISYEAAVYSLRYYRKWLIHHQATSCYTVYELQILRSFEENRANNSNIVFQEVM